jgi:hypothetical protein
VIKNFKLIVLLILCLSVGLWAQTVILSDEFDAGDGKWNSGWIEGSTVVTFSIDTNSVLSGKNSYLADITNASATTYNIQRNANAPLLAGNKYTLSFMAVTDKEGASINVLFEIAGDPYTKRLNVIETIATTPTVYTYTVIATEDVADNMVKLHYGGTQNNGAKIWIDNVVVTEEVDTGPISDWGEDGLGYAWAVLNDSNTVAGSAGMAGTQPMATNGSSLFGGFDTLQATTDQAVVVSGQLEFIGSPGPVYTALRFALTFLDSLSLQHQYTDSARWIGAKGVGYYGYEFTPRSGGGTQPNGSGGNGSVWSIINGNWPSTYSNGGGPVGPVVDQSPRNATILEGTYEWAVSVQQVNDTTNEVRWSLYKTDDKYLFAGTVLAPAVTNKLNGIGFWTKEGEHTQMNITNAKINLGAPIPIPEPIWEDYYVDQWGFIGNRIGGWTNETGTYVGDFSLSGAAAPTDWSAVRGGFDPVELKENEILVLEGDIELVGGGFQDWSSLRLGLFYSDSAGTVTQDPALDSSYVWTGVETHHSGYLFSPHSGTNAIPTWSGTEGTYGAIIDGNWISTNTGTGYVLGTKTQVPAGAVAGAATYAFKMGVQLLEDGTIDLRMQLMNGDDYVWEISTIDANDPLATTKFNCVCFAINNTTTTAMHLKNVEVTKPDEWFILDIEQEVFDLIPTVYSLSQNYPNPFNPSTTIKFGLPKNSEVKLVVYDVLGQVVAQLAKKDMTAGYHTVTFSASRFSSGIYFYRIEAGDFVKTKKMMLLK